MSMSKDMDNEEDLFKLLSTLILEKDDDIPFRLKAQEQAWTELKCTHEELGAWVAHFDFPFLIETLLLDDTIFLQEFPGVVMTTAERAELAKALESHCEPCARCHLKRSYDLEWQSRVDRAFEENREVIAKAIGHAAGKK